MKSDRRCIPDPSRPSARRTRPRPRRGVFALLMLAPSLMLAGCGGGCGGDGEGLERADGTSLDPIVLSVDGASLTAEQFQESYIGHLIRTGRNDTPEERWSHLDLLTRDLLLADRAEAFGMPPLPHRLHVERVRRKAVADAFYTRAFMDSLAPPTEAQVRTAFTNMNTRVGVGQLYFTDEREAWEWYGRWRDGESFADLANELYQTTEYDSLAGYLGEIGYFGVDHAFAEAAFSLRPGEVSEPVATRVGVSLVTVYHRVAPPILTETQFEAKRQGVTERVKERILSLEGDAFVRGYMQGLQVRTEREALLDLAAAVGGIPASAPRLISGREVSVQRTAADSRDASRLEQMLGGERALARYASPGKGEPGSAPPGDAVFTVAEYAFWLPTLPLEEVRGRTAASVGRALRNQAFYEAGLAIGVDRDPEMASVIEQEVAMADLRYRSWYARGEILGMGASADRPSGEGRSDAPSGVEGRTMEKGDGVPAEAAYRRLAAEVAGMWERATIEVDTAAFVSLMEHLERDSGRTGPPRP